MPWIPKVSSKRKQQLCFAKSEKIKQPTGLPHKPPGSSTSHRKRSLGNRELVDGAGDGATQQRLIVHVSRLKELISDLLCPNCSALSLSINIDPENQGFCSSLLLECKNCKAEGGYRRSVYTSTRLQSETQGDVAFDVNVRMVLLAHKLGMGYATLGDPFPSFENIPETRQKSYR